MSKIGASKTRDGASRHADLVNPRPTHLRQQPAELGHRVVGRLGSDDRVLRRSSRPSSQVPIADHGLAHLEGERDLRKRPELAADRDHGVGASRDDRVARLAEPGRDRHGQVPRRRRRAHRPAGCRSRRRRPPPRRARRRSSRRRALRTRACSRRRRALVRARSAVASSHSVALLAPITATYGGVPMAPSITQRCG